MTIATFKPTVEDTTPIPVWRPRLRRWLWRMSPALFDALARRPQEQEFSIGIYRGRSLTELANEDGAANPVLTRRDVTDIPAAFVADPFMIRRDGTWYMFFEVLDATDYRGRIALASSPDTRHWQYRGVVLAEPFHMAYPQVFEWRGQTYMIPDTPDQGVILYRAVEFPHRWARCEQLLTEPAFSDSSVFQSAGRLWMLSYWRGAGTSALRLFHAPAPSGPWREHPASPVVRNDPSISRPGGRVVVVDGVPIRFAQDCSVEYGKLVRAFRITLLDPERYEERELVTSPLLTSGPDPWHEGGMHHVDAHRLDDGRWVACVDGW